MPTTSQPCFLRVTGMGRLIISSCFFFCWKVCWALPIIRTATKIQFPRLVWQLFLTIIFCLLLWWMLLEILVLLLCTISLLTCTISLSTWLIFHVYLFGLVLLCRSSECMSHCLPTPVAWAFRIIRFVSFHWVRIQRQVIIDKSEDKTYSRCYMSQVIPCDTSFWSALFHVVRWFCQLCSVYYGFLFLFHLM